MKKNIAIIIAVCTVIIFVAIVVVVLSISGANDLPEATLNNSFTVSESKLQETPIVTEEDTSQIKQEPTPTIQVSTPDIEDTQPFIFDENNPDYREAMRQWVMLIGNLARSYDEDFLLIPQNSAELFTLNGSASGQIHKDFLDAIDGIGVEGISYGNNKYNKPRKENSKTDLVNLLDVGVKNGIVTLAVDYCSGESNISDVMQLNEQHGFKTFIAEDMELTLIPEDRVNPNNDSVISLDDAKNWLYLLNPERYSSKKSFVKAISETNYDVIVIDAFFDTDEMFTEEDVAELKAKADGGTRIVIAYMSIGEAEDYRYYWIDEFYDNPPEWMLTENSEWEGNYPVEYWQPEWQEIIATGEDSYLKRLLSAGFDGVYLDIVDGYETFEDMR